MTTTLELSSPIVADERAAAAAPAPIELDLAVLALVGGGTGGSHIGTGAVIFD